MYLLIWFRGTLHEDTARKLDYSRRQVNSTKSYEWIRKCNRYKHVKGDKCKMWIAIRKQQRRNVCSGAEFWLKQWIWYTQNVKLIPHWGVKEGFRWSDIAQLHIVLFIAVFRCHSRRPVRTTSTFNKEVQGMLTIWKSLVEKLPSFGFLSESL